MSLEEKHRGLYGKYHVERVDKKPMNHGCIVLEWNDPAARRGIEAFAEAVRDKGYLQLADDLESRLEAYGPVLSGYDKALRAISELPMTWIPALLLHMVRTAYEKRVFLKGKATTFVRDNISGEEPWKN